ncbi:phenylalanine--tRNA ligase subunit beta [Stackebrandtia soli]|uniref:phenylalanine--tRNA ligase subunit beta n=1 Tax=Stackebrandtia soli TaxID=1892856 RepID=UPI0039ED095F
MRVSVSWLREYVDLGDELTVADLDAALVQCGLEVEEIHDLTQRVTGPLVVGKVVSIEELTEFKKPIRHCMVDVGEGEPRSIVCGARNFAEGDRVIVALPGAVLPGDFAIATRKTYGKISDGMIASGRELGVSDDHDGILVLPESLDVALGADARPIVGLDDVIIELAITPDMGYCFCMRGVAREVAHRLQLPWRDPAMLVEEPKATADGAYPLIVEDTHGCDRFALRRVTGVDPMADSPEWMKRRLVAAGMRPISLPVDITNYLMLELGQPLHAFDAARLAGPLVVRRARVGETLTTLDDVERRLEPEDMVICDDTGPLSLAGVMGGQTSEVTPDTTDVLIEGAHWEASMVTRTARRHRLTSEAGKRFERGVDAGLCAIAVQRAAQLLVEYGGGTISENVSDVDHRAAATPIVIDASLPARIIGVDYTDSDVDAALAAAGCDFVREGERLSVVPPSWRPDITSDADVVEEVARLDGYDRVPSVLPSSPPGPGLTPVQRRRRIVGRTLAARGTVETVNYPFIDTGLFDVYGMELDDARRRVVTLVNPLVDSEPALRTTLLPGLLKALKLNVDRGHRDVGLFETGLVFSPSPDAEAAVPSPSTADRPTDAELAAFDAVRPIQPYHVGAVFHGRQELSGWWGDGRVADWSDAVALAVAVGTACGVTLEVRQGRYAPWHPGRCAELLVDGVVVGHAGELHPAVCGAVDVPKRTCAMELDLDAIPLPPIESSPLISHYPAALLDVAVVVDSGVAAADVAASLARGAGELLEDLRLFDVYSGGKLGEGRKSLAYNLTFRAPDRTLTAEETVAARDNAVAIAADDHGAELRAV